jgi:hypothetical protein
MCQDIFGRIDIMYQRLPYVSGDALPLKTLVLYIYRPQWINKQPFNLFYSFYMVSTPNTYCATNSRCLAPLLVKRFNKCYTFLPDQFGYSRQAKCSIGDKKKDMIHIQVEQCDWSCWEDPTVIVSSFLTREVLLHWNRLRLNYILCGAFEPPYRMSLIEISPIFFRMIDGLPCRNASSSRVVVTAIHLQDERPEQPYKYGFFSYFWIILLQDVLH